jgi:hypothetical protein
MGRLRAIVWSLIRREDDPERVDCGALVTLVLFLLLAASIVFALFVWPAVYVAIWGLDLR